MLKITCLTTTANEAIFKLEGKLVGPWVEEFQRAVSPAAKNPAPLRLDLAGVAFADAAGADCLRTLLRGGAQLVACSGFVAELLELPSQEKS